MLQGGVRRRGRNRERDGSDSERRCRAYGRGIIGSNAILPR
jgi:hypothetical protein